VHLWQLFSGFKVANHLLPRTCNQPLHWRTFFGNGKNFELKQTDFIQVALIEVLKT